LQVWYLAQGAAVGVGSRRWWADLEDDPDGTVPDEEFAKPDGEHKESSELLRSADVGVQTGQVECAAVFLEAVVQTETAQEAVY